MSITFYHQWQFLYQACNWYDFTFLRFNVEYDKIFGDLSCNMTLLGFGADIVWNFEKTDAGERLAQSMVRLEAYAEGEMFVPNAVHIATRNYTEMVLEDELIVWEVPNTSLTYVELGYSEFGKLIGIRVYGDVLYQNDVVNNP